MARRYTKDAQVNAELWSLLDKGWKINKHRRHWRVYDPQGCLRVAISVSPGDARAYVNMRIDLKRARKEYGESE